MRRDLVPRTPAPFDFETAIHTGLAVYYFPAMDDWSRTIVRPLALEGFRRAMREDRAAYEAAAPIDAALDDEYERWSRLGDLLLHRFFAFAAAFDDFDSVLADDDLWVPVPDPDRPGFELGTRDGRPIRYLCRLDQLIADTDDEWWVVDHRLSWGSWATDAELLGAQRTIRTLWALETAYPQIHVAGTVHNELAVPPDGDVAPPPVDVDELDRRDMSGARRINLRRSPLTPEERILGAAFDRPDEIAHREEAHEVRRTWVRRGHGELHLVGAQIARRSASDARARRRRRAVSVARPVRALRLPCAVPGHGRPRDEARRRRRDDVGNAIQTPLARGVRRDRTTDVGAASAQPSPLGRYLAPFSRPAVAIRRSRPGRHRSLRRSAARRRGSKTADPGRDEA